jgi:hypothetical protein
MLENPERTLVIFLSLALALFLTLAIFVLVQVLQILKRVRNISEKVDDIAERADAAATVLSKASPGIAFGGLVSYITNVLKRTDNTKQGGQDHEKKE